MLDLTDKEYETVIDIVSRVQHKHMDGSDFTWDKARLLHQELEGRLNDAGFIVTVDVTPMREGMPPVLRIDDRIEPKEFDPEHKQYDVQHRTDFNPQDDIEGAV